MRINEIINEVNTLEVDDLNGVIDNNIRYLKGVILSLNKLSSKLRLGFKEQLSLIILLLSAEGDELTDKEYDSYINITRPLNLEERDITSSKEYFKALVVDDSLINDIFKSLAKTLNFLANKDHVLINNAILGLFASYIKVNREISARDKALLEAIDASLYGDELEYASKRDEAEPLYVSRNCASIGVCEGRKYLSVGAEIKNPNTIYMATEVIVEITCRDKDNNIVIANKDIIPCIDSNTIFYYGSEISLADYEIEGYDIRVECKEFMYVHPNELRVCNNLRIEDFKLSKKKNGSSYKITGKMKNPFIGIIKPEMYFVFYDEEDEILGGAKAERTILFPARLNKLESLIYSDIEIDAKKIKYSSAFNLVDANRKMKR